MNFVMHQGSVLGVREEHNSDWGERDRLAILSQH